MSCFLQTSAGDLDFSAHQLQLVTDLPTITAQKLTNRFQLFLGEWFMDTRQGVPYYQQVFVKNPDLGAIGQLFKNIILQTPGVADVLTANLNFLSSARSLSAVFSAQTDDGAILTGGLGVPFIVQSSPGSN